MRTLQQEYAAEVYKCIQEIQQMYQADEKKQKEYGAMAMKLPILVRQSGLVQALTFVATRGKDSQRHILGHLANVVRSSADLLEEAREARLGEYMFLTRRVLWALEWFKRFAQAELRVDPTTETE